MSVAAPDLLTCLLRDVSRSFYLTLRLVPSEVRPQIGLAYLLARATDTIADTEVLPLDQRLQALNGLRDRIVGTRLHPVELDRLAENQALPAERHLLSRVEEAIQVLHGFACFDRCCIREVITTICSGQALDLQRFHGATPKAPVALQHDQELDDYTYRVAGCVGGFWTRVCRSHLYPEAALDLPRYLDDGVRFGKGLQLVNILRDLPADLRKGRCYLPAEGLARHGLEPAALLQAGPNPGFRLLYQAHLQTALSHLAAGWRYTCDTPRRQVRVRLACALPLLIGLETLRLLARRDVLGEPDPVKIPRRQVKGLLLRAILLHPFPRRWERLFEATLLLPPAA